MFFVRLYQSKINQNKNKTKRELNYTIKRSSMNPSMCAVRKETT